MLTCLFIAAAWFVASVAASAAGVGIVMLSMPMLTLLMRPVDAVLVACLVSGIWVLLQLASYREFVSLESVLFLGFGAVPGCFLGSHILSTVSVSFVECLAAFMILCFLGMQFLPGTCTVRLPDSRAVDVAAGAVCGTFAAAVGMDGPPLVVYSLLKGWTPGQSRGRMSVFFIFTTVGCIASQWISGLYSMHLVPWVLAGLAGMVPGQKVGVLVGRRLRGGTFRRLLFAFLFCAACSLLWRGLA